MKSAGWRLTDILVTHHHADHTGGIAELKQHHRCRVVAPHGEAARIPLVDDEQLLGRAAHAAQFRHADEIAQVPQVEKNVSMAMALAIIQGTIEQCTRDGYKVSVTVVDKAGNVAASLRGDGTNPHTMEFSRMKAYTSRTRGQTSLEFMKLTSDPADLFGLKDRGRLAPGLRADVNLIDFERLRLYQPELVHDMPAGGRRFVQRVQGYEATLVAGTPIFERGEHTGALPGRLVRAGRERQALHAAE